MLFTGHRVMSWVQVIHLDAYIHVIWSEFILLWSAGCPKLTRLSVYPQMSKNYRASIGVYGTKSENSLLKPGRAFSGLLQLLLFGQVGEKLYWKPSSQTKQQLLRLFHHVWSKPHTLKYFTDCLHQPGPVENGRLLDFGPSLYNAMVASRIFSHITMAEYAEPNRDVIQKWIRNNHMLSIGLVSSPFLRNLKV